MLVSSDAALSRQLRTEFLAGQMPVKAFVDRTLVFFQNQPLPPKQLVVHPERYWPSSLKMSAANVARFQSLAWDLIERSTLDPHVRQQAQGAVDELMGRMDGEILPGRLMQECADSEIVEMYCELVRVVTNVADPYSALKSGYNSQALRYLPEMGKQIDSLANLQARFKTAISLGIIGNAIDFADPLRKAHLENHGFDIEQEFQKAEHLAYAHGLDARDSFLKQLRSQSNQLILFLVDNAGEIIFDMPLVRLLLSQGYSVVLAGKQIPCYNDMTAAELRALLVNPTLRNFFGSHIPYVSVVDSGTMMIGCDLRRATPELIEYWNRAGMVYAKGQGMLQTLRCAELTRDVFHAVQVKDPAYFHEGVELKAGDALFLRTRPA
ncbi:MAG: DUF89 family protein [Candidatus Omnitrophica bacterium]|nr:DUF89 family protein [Candidatus Omnitrophota bacterium]